jgi:hypothetical protein
MSVLKAGGNSNGNGRKSEQVMKGVYLSEVEILDVVDKSQVDIYGKTYDLAIKLLLKDGEYEKKKTLKGNFTRVDGLVKDWGGAFTIDNLIKALGIYEKFSKSELDDVMVSFEQSKVPASIIKLLKGNKVFSISYLKGIEDGKKKYGAYSKVLPDKEKLVESFKADIAKGFPSDYHPELVEDATSFNPAEFEKVVQTVAEDVI